MRLRRAEIRGTPTSRAEPGYNLDVPSSQTLRAYVVEDHELIRAGIKAVLQSSGTITVVGESSDHARSVDEITSLAPDIALIGVRLDDERGLESCRRIRASSPSVKTLVLTSLSGQEALRSAVLAGASGVLPKSITASLLVKSVTDVAQGATLYDARQVLDLMGREPDLEDLVADLSTRERDLLALVGQGMSNQEIAERLFLVEKTVRNQVTRLLAKLRVRSRTQAALIAAKVLR